MWIVRWGPVRRRWTQAAATAQALLPEAKVWPAPRSQTSTRSELHIGAVGKGGMIFNLRAEFHERQAVQILAPYHAMRIAKRQDGHRQDGV